MAAPRRGQGARTVSPLAWPVSRSWLCHSFSLFSDTIIINVSARLSTGKSQVFSLASGNPRDLLSCQNADAVRHALATADAAGRSALPAVRRPTVKRSARQNDPRRQNLMPRHVAAPLFVFSLPHKGGTCLWQLQQPQAQQRQQLRRRSRKFRQWKFLGLHHAAAGRGSCRWTQRTGSARLDRVRLSLEDRP